MVKDLPEEDYENRATMSANEFSKLVFEISQQLKVRDVEALKYMYGVFEENISNLRVLTVLESRGVFSNSNIDGLRTLLRNIQRCDLLEMLRETEQDRRLKLCYFQAMSLEEKLKAIKDELISFAGKQECSPTERSFCSKITDRVEMVRKEMKEFLVQPLGEVITVDGRFGSSSAGDGRSKIWLPSQGRSPHHWSRQMPRPHPIQRAAQYARNAGQGVSHAQSKAPHVWSFSCPKNREGSDYDKLSPAGMNPDDAQLSDVHFPCTDPVGSHTGPHATSTGTIDQSPQERAKKKTGLIGSKTEFIQERPLSTSMPGSPFLIQKKSLKHRSNSVENLASPSNIPVPIRKLSPRGSAHKISDGSDVEMYSGSTGSGDSGFCDPTEFSRLSIHHRSSAAEDHIYTHPIKHMMNDQNPYCTPTKREDRH